MQHQPEDSCKYHSGRVYTTNSHQVADYCCRLGTGRQSGLHTCTFSQDMGYGTPQVEEQRLAFIILPQRMLWYIPVCIPNDIVFLASC
jgi:hypothetical protein